MRSLHHGSVAGNHKMRGKRTCVMNCGCCDMVNFKLSERLKEADAEIQSVFDDERAISRRHYEVLSDMWALDDSETIWQNFLQYKDEISTRSGV